jgi:hypothetical protein
LITCPTLSGLANCPASPAFLSSSVAHRRGTRARRIFAHTILLANDASKSSAWSADQTAMTSSSPQKKWYELQKLGKYVRRAKGCDPEGHCGTRVPPAYLLNFTDERILVIRDFDVRGVEQKHGGDHA